jgi:hypothetical protein
MKKIYVIHVHSFIDLITNSSTEIYIQASDKTVAAIKQVIDGILVAGGSAKRCADLFEVSLDKDRLLEDYGDGAKWTPDTFYQHTIDNSDGETVRNIYIKVSCTAPSSEDGKAAAKVLSALTGLFDLQAIYS